MDGIVRTAMAKLKFFDDEVLAEAMRTRIQSIQARLCQILSIRGEGHDEKQAGIRLPNDVAVLLGNYVQSNVRELEGLLRHLIARASMYGRDITVDDAKDALQLRGLAHRGAGQNILEVQSVVADKLGVSVDELKGKSRKREVARARQIAMFLSREVTGDSLAVVGAHFGKRDQSTVVHAIQTIQTLASTDPNIEKLLKELRTEFKR